MSNKAFVRIWSIVLALRQGFQAEFDVLFLDIEMPRLDGMSAARQIRERDEQVTIIFITNMAQYAIHGYEVGALDFPFEARELRGFGNAPAKGMQARAGAAGERHSALVRCRAAQYAQDRGKIPGDALSQAGGQELSALCHAPAAAASLRNLKPQFDNIRFTLRRICDNIHKNP